jgi:hypothetical protein
MLNNLTNSGKRPANQSINLGLCIATTTSITQHSNRRRNSLHNFGYLLGLGPRDNQKEEKDDHVNV